MSPPDSAPDARPIETIRCAAIKLKGRVYHLDPPARHINVWISIPDPKPVGLEIQGFLTSKGRFVRRKRARQIAQGANQLRPGATASTELFSEDLW